MNDLMTKSFISYVDFEKETMKDIEAGPDYDLEMFSNEESKSLHKQESLKTLRNKINNNIVTVQKKAKTSKAQFEEMNRVNAKNKRLSGCKEGTLAYQIRMAVTNELRNKLKELMLDFQGLRQKMMTEYKESVGRRSFTVTSEDPDEEIIEKIISDGNGGEGF